MPVCYPSFFLLLLLLLLLRLPPSSSALTLTLTLILSTTPSTTNLSLKDIITNIPSPLPPMFPVFTRTMPVALAGGLVDPLLEPLGPPLLAGVLALPPRGTLLLLDAVLLRRRKVVLAVFHGALVGPQARVGRWEDGAQRFRHGVECHNKRCQIEGDACGSFVGFPDQKGLLPR